MKYKEEALAKIIPPSYSRVFPRKRLFTHLDHGRKRPVVWVAGPAGSGKTVLVSSYLKSRKLPCLWYQVDRGDADAATFFYYMGLAAENAPSKTNPLPLLTPEYLPGLPVFTRRYFEELYRRLKPPFCLVFDNYQEAPEGSLFHEIIRDGLEVIPSGINVIIISRSEPPAALARLRVSNQMEVVGGDELYLTPEESCGIISLRVKRKGIKEAFLKIHDRTKGWAAGLVLVLEYLKKGLVEEKSLKGAAEEAIFDYFYSEIFEKTDRDTQQALLKTSFLPSLNSEMAQRLTGLENAGRILSDLSRNNCFTERRFNTHPVYQYHPLFHEFLLSRAKDVFTAAEVKRLQRKAAEILDETARFEDAFVLLRDAGDWEGVASLAIRHARSLIMNGRGKVLEEWITGLPKPMLEESPWLLYWLGFCRMPFNPALSRRGFEAAYRLFKAEKDITGIFMAWSAIVDTIIYEWKDFHPLDHWITEFEGLLKEYGKFPSPEVEERASACMFSALMFRQPHHQELPRWEERVKIIIHESTDNPRRMFIGYNLILYYLWRGQNARAGSIVSELSQAFRSAEDATLPQLMWHFSEALYDYHTAAYKKALEGLEEGIKKAEKAGIHLFDVLFYGTAVLNSLAIGEVDAAEASLKKMAASMTRASCFDTIFYHHQVSLAALNKGEYSSAIEHARTALKLSDEVGAPFFRNITRIALAYILIEAGKYRSVARHIEEIRGFGRSSKSMLSEYASFLTEAVWALNEKDEERSLERFSRALTLGKAQDIKFFILLRRQSASRLCANALKAGIETDFVKELIRLNALSPEDMEIEEWPWPLKIYAFGRFELYKDGKKIEFTRKTQQKPLDLLKALLAMGGKDVKEDRLTDALWPDAEGDAAHSVFATTLHRLRQIIGAEKALQLRDGRLSLDERYCWADTWALERILRQADDAVKNYGSKGSTAVLMEKALSFYQGAFLPADMDKAWTVSFREHVRSKILKYISGMGCSLENAGEHKKAIELFKKGIEIDGLTEEFYQHIMVCCRTLGHRAEAIAAYELLKKNLLSRLGIGPSPKTVSIYISIISQ